MSGLSELKLCPFCGGQGCEFPAEDGCGGSFIRCTTCAARTKLSGFPGSDSIADLWNRRVELPFWPSWSGPSRCRPTRTTRTTTYRRRPSSGQINIEWKSWKKYDEPGALTPWDTYITASTLVETKALVELAITERIRSALGETA